MILQKNPSDPLASLWLLRDSIAARYGWTFHYIDSLDMEAIAGIQAILAAEARYQKRKELEMRMRMKS
jgi:hypothetical protein